MVTLKNLFLRRRRDRVVKQLAKNILGAPCVWVSGPCPYSQDKACRAYAAEKAEEGATERSAQEHTL